MINMGIFKSNGQKVQKFTCNQCKQQNRMDFRFYPLCKKCKRTNLKLAKREKDKEKKEENSWLPREKW